MENACKFINMLSKYMCDAKNDSKRDVNVNKQNVYIGECE